jgi:hypothetical protein
MLLILFLFLFIAAGSFLLVLWRINASHLLTINALNGEIRVWKLQEQADAEYYISTKRHLEMRIADLEKFIQDSDTEDEEVVPQPPSPGTCIPLPEPVTNLIQRLKLRHTARIAAYDVEQKKTDLANKHLGEMYRELQCSTADTINRLRAQLDAKLKVTCPVCTHIYKAPEPVVRSHYKKQKGVIQSVPAVAERNKLKSRLKPTQALTNGKTHRRSTKRNPD